MITKKLIISLAVSMFIISPTGLIAIKLGLCILLGILIWGTITRPMTRKRTFLQKLKDYLGQIVLSVVCTYIIKKYVSLENDLEFLVAGFISGLFSYALLLVYRLINSTQIIDFLKSKFGKK